MDEVGRGAWAGPVSVGVALIPLKATKRTLPRWLRDSKQLSEARRESIFDSVGAWCVDWAVGHASPEECDRWGMRIALRLASQRALAGLERPPDALLVDGPLDLVAGAEPDEGAYCGPVHPVIGGDARCASVAAASVLAKVVRDRLMRAESEHFPPYAFEQNKGYPSPTHQMALRGLRPFIHPPPQLVLRDVPSLVRQLAREPRKPALSWVGTVSSPAPRSSVGT
jgi:ribonuclease HII